MHVYIFVMNPPVSVVNQLHKIFAKIFWKNATGSKNKHWVSWNLLCYPKKEGGLGFRTIYDMFRALFTKV